MRPGNVLHWGALLFAIASVSWALTSVLGGLASLAIATGFAASIVTLIAARTFSPAARGLALTGTIVALVSHLLFVVAFIGNTPINFKGDSARGVNQDPPAFFEAILTGVGSWLPLLLIAAIVITFWGIWSLRDRALGGIGLLLIVALVLLDILGVGGGDTVLGLLLQLTFAIGFLAAAAALAMPLWAGSESDDPAQTAWS